MTEKIELIYSAMHEKCGREIKQKDPKVADLYSINALIRKALWEGEWKAIDLFCPYCFEQLQPTEMEIFVDGQSSLRRKVNEFVPNKWRMVLN